ncbi:MAG: PCI domain-containing protein [Candidatus Hodarchaeota archaeon]
MNFDSIHDIMFSDQAGAKCVLLKKGKWQTKNLERLRNSQEPLKLSNLVKEKKIDELKSEIKQAISENKLDGFLSRSEDSYVPHHIVQSALADQVSTGVVDKVPMIRNLNISAKTLEPIIEGLTEGKTGFWDLKRRRWFSLLSAKEFLLDKLSDSDKIYAWEIMQEFNWSIERLQEILSLLANEGSISGFIDRNHMINVTSVISRDLILRSPRAIETFASFTQTYLAEIGDDGIPIQLILQLFKLSRSQFDQLIAHVHQEGVIGTVISDDGQRLLSLAGILELIVRYILVLEPFPIHLLAKQLSLSPELLEDILQKLQAVVSAGEIKGSGIFAPSAESLKRRLEGPVDMEAFASVFNVSPTLSMRLIQIMASAYGLRLVNKGTEVTGIEDLDIFCQLDGTVYEQQVFSDEPKFYRECMNCKRIVCASCYDSRESKTCPFCDNISQFILEFPRYCPSCGLTYLEVEGLQSSEKCRLCGYAPLEKGWTDPIAYPESVNRKKILERLNSSTGKTIPLTELAAVAGLAEKVLEEEIIGMILDGIVQARIDLAQGVLIRYEVKEEAKCFICQRSEKLEAHCTQCNAVVCQKCVNDLQKVKAFFCIECNGDLEFMESLSAS